MATTSSTSGPTTRPHNAKLRSTCNPCATAKVGCGKEKPTCSRCANRGLECHYSTTKRAGRVSHSVRQAADISRRNVTQHSTDDAVNTIENAGLSGWASTSLTPSAPNQPSATTSFPSDGTDLFAINLSTSDRSHTLLPSTSSPGFDDFLASAPYFQTDNLFPDHDFSAPSPLENNNNINHNHGNNSSGSSSSSYFNPLRDFGFDSSNDYSISNVQAFMRPTSSYTSINHKNNNNTQNHNLVLNSNRSSISLFPGASQGPSMIPMISTLPNSRNSRVPTPRLSPESTVGPSRAAPPSCKQNSHLDSSLRCFPRTLALLPQCLLSASELHTQSTTGASPVVRASSFERVMAQNEQTVEAVKATLQCSCASGDYLLVILSLAVIGVLDSYAVISCSTICGDQSQNESAASSWDSQQELLQQDLTTRVQAEAEGEDEQRIAGQRILSKFSVVRQLINTLSERLQELGEKAHDNETWRASVEEENDHGARDSSFDLKMLHRPFSANLTHTLRADMRKKLQQISRAIIERLRRE